MEFIHGIRVTDLIYRRLSLHALKSWSIFSWLGLHGLIVQAITGVAEERVAREGDSVSFTCSNFSSAGNSVVWLYTPGEAYEGVQHIYADGRMFSRWTSKCNFTTNATASTLVLDSVHSDSAGYYECSEEHLSGYYVRFRVKLVVSDDEGSIPNVAAIIDACKNAIIISGTAAVVFIVVCTLLTLLVVLRPVLRKRLDRQTIEDEMTKCGKISSNRNIEDAWTFGSPLLLNQPTKEHLPLPYDQMSFLKSEHYDLKASLPPVGA